MPDAEGVTMDRDDHGVCGQSLQFPAYGVVNSTDRVVTSRVGTTARHFRPHQYLTRLLPRCLALSVVSLRLRAGFVACLSAIEARVDAPPQDLAVTGAIDTFNCCFAGGASDEAQ